MQGRTFYPDDVPSQQLFIMSKDKERLALYEFYFTPLASGLQSDVKEQHLHFMQSRMVTDYFLFHAECSGTESREILVLGSPHYLQNEKQ